MNFEQIKNIVKSRMSERRFAHSERVSENAVLIAESFGIDAEKARLAGILHDVAKEYGDDQFLDIAEKNGIPISDGERKSPHKLHGKIGAVIARDEFGITDKMILSGIANHFGCVGMTDFDEVIFLADILDKGIGMGEPMHMSDILSYKSPDDAVLYVSGFVAKEYVKGNIRKDFDIRIIYDYVIDKKLRENGKNFDPEEWMRKRETICGDEVFDNLINISITHSVGVNSVKNIRDMGGYDTADGRKVRANRLIRSGVLSALTQEDADRLFDMGVNYVIDLRSEADQKELPDNCIEKFHKETCELSSIEKTDYQNELIGASKGLFSDVYHATGMGWMNGEFLKELDMEQMYRDILSSECSIRSLRKMLDILLRDDCTGAIIHCRDGKDRTGIAAIILLYILGVDTKDIALDYMASSVPNFAITELYDSYFAQHNYDEETRSSSQREKSVDMDLITSVRDWFREQFGDMTAYLHNVLGLDEDYINRFSEKYCV